MNCSRVMKLVKRNEGVEMFKSEGISIKRAEYFEGEIKAFIDVSK